MAEKFPPIENLDINDTEAQQGQDDGDFLAREKAALGDEFTTEDDQKILSEANGDDDDDDDEISQFQSQFPDVSKNGSSDSHGDDSHVPDFTTTDNNNGAGDEDYESNVFSNGGEKKESAPVKEWKEKRDKAIAEKDKISQQKHEEIKKEAKELIDQFYDSYNAKTELNVNLVKEEEASFIDKRDAFFKNDSSVWDRAIKLIDLKKSSAAADVNGRDKTRFKELLLSLKGKTEVPGAAGY